MSRTSRRELAIVVLFSLALLLPYAGGAYHIDEPFFLIQARHILRDPLNPTGFSINCLGSLRPVSQAHAYPPLMPYLLAPSMALSGGSEWAMRLLNLPFDLLAACCLYLLAARFLASPLLPALIVLSCPAYFLDMRLLMAEKYLVALGLAGLYALVRGIEDRRPPIYWASAVLLASAFMVKYSALCLIAAALAYSWRKRVPPRRLALYAALCVLPVAIFLGWGALSDTGRIASVVNMAGSGAAALWSETANKLRSLLAFIGGCGLVTVVWPFLTGRPGRRSWALAAVCAMASVILFLPHLDSNPVRGVDRVMGVFLSGGALLGLVETCRTSRGDGWWLWFACLLCALALEAGPLWSISSRYVLLIVLPLIFILAGVLEDRLSPATLRSVYALSLLANVVFSSALLFVDSRYAQAQKDVAALVAERYIFQGRRVWFAGHWGLQHYMEKAGAVALDSERGGWAQALPGDVVVVPRVNSNFVRPRSPVLADTRILEIACPVPLRLMSNTPDVQAGFYSNAFGFLPFALTREPVDVFSFVEIL